MNGIGHRHHVASGTNSGNLHPQIYRLLIA